MNCDIDGSACALSILWLLTSLCAGCSAQHSSRPSSAPLEASKIPKPRYNVDVTATLAFMNDLMDRYHRDIDVYTDESAGGNHFVSLARLAGEDEPEESADAALPPLKTNYPEPGRVLGVKDAKPKFGTSCIEATFRVRKDRKGPHWGGWYFQEGVLAGTERTPRTNWGTVGGAGLNLTGAKSLSFWARGARGGERIEFFCGGVGLDTSNNPIASDKNKQPIVAHDSMAKRNSVLAAGEKQAQTIVTLENHWKQYTIDLSGADLHFVMGGFGWVAKDDGQPMDASKESAGGEYDDVTFYLDDIKYVLTEKARADRLNQPRFIVSYETEAGNHDFDKILKNSAFAYDNSLALMAYLTVGDKRRAGLIADAFVEAQAHDRQADGRHIRTAYQAGDLFLPPGWTPFGRKDCVRTPGWMDSITGEKDRNWLEDAYFLGLNTGNMCYIAMAILSYHETLNADNPRKSSKYLTVAVQLADYIRSRYKVENSLGGYQGGAETDEKAPKFIAGQEHNKKLEYRATEHAIDYYAVCVRLSYLKDTPEIPKWKNEAVDALRFVKAMWDDGKHPGSPKDEPYQSAPGKFWTGTLDGGSGINRSVVPADIQVWSHLSLRVAGKPYLHSMEYAEQFHRNGLGFDFKQAGKNGGVWPEGTAQMAVGYTYLGKTDRAAQIMEFLQTKLINGAMPAALPNDALSDTLFTGFNLSNGEPWNYFRRKHLGASAWFVLGAYGASPYYLNSKAPDVALLPADVQPQKKSQN